ncbi:unnamed protein product [Linum trigynum]|uniref:Uncharacterized protein n=1 Tax=Linum trigynum TaxID=586398 RepID=A0AAV2CL39_9ROSI
MGRAANGFTKAGETTRLVQSTTTKRGMRHPICNLQIPNESKPRTRPKSKSSTGEETGMPHRSEKTIEN